MINKIQLNNFQAHQNSTLEFVDGLNVITGQSDQGKSSIIHALYWLFLNKPSGTEFVNWNSKSCSVKAFIGDQTIERYRGTTNSYIINGNQFDAVRSDVPQQVSEIIKISSTNIQLQDDPYFLLYSQSGEIAKQLNQVVGIDQIDLSLQYVNKIVRKQNTLYTFLEEEIKSKETELKKYDSVKEVETAYRDYKKINEAKQETLDSLLQLDKAILGLSEFDEMQDYEELLQKLEVKIQRFGTLSEKHDRIENKLSEVANCISDIEDTEQFIITVDKGVKSLVKLLKQFVDLKAQFDENEQLKLIVSHTQELSACSKRVIRLESELQETSTEFEELKKELKICPLCDQPF